MGVPTRRTRAIRTHASIFKSGSQSDERHVHQFQLASLELERTRRTREKQAALRRVGDVDARLAEVEGLMRKHQAVLGLSSQGGESQETGAPMREAPASPRRVLRY